MVAGLVADGAKSALVGSVGAETLRASVFDLIRGPEWPSPYDGRALQNHATRRWHGEKTTPRNELDAARAEYAKADAALDFSQKVIWAEEGLDMIHDAPRAAEIIERIVHEADSAMKGAVN